MGKCFHLTGISTPPCLYCLTAHTSSSGHGDPSLQSETEELIPLPPGKTLVAYRWIYLVKVGPDGQVDHLKTCLVAKG
ncbi:receptor-like protein kinase, partial [Trifolium medium]|nr:receptor-like protein kinase [Trifolium medium]